MNWSNKKPSKIEPEFASLIATAEERRQRKQKKRNNNKQAQGSALFFQGIVNNVSAPEVDYNFECGCYGTEHGVINNCIKCGRIICKREGERPCPYCGTLIFSDETLSDPDLLEKRKSEMIKRIGTQKWVPMVERDTEVATKANEFTTDFIDLETDWFDSELLEIFQGTP